jgi:hypothetical protein
MGMTAGIAAGGSAGAVIAFPIAPTASGAVFVGSFGELKTATAKTANTPATKPNLVSSDIVNSLTVLVEYSTRDGGDRTT